MQFHQPQPAHCCGELPHLPWLHLSPCRLLPSGVVTPFVSSPPSLFRAQTRAWIWTPLVLPFPMHPHPSTPEMLAVTSSSWVPPANQLMQLEVWGQGLAAGYSRKGPALLPHAHLTLQGDK